MYLYRDVSMTKCNNRSSYEHSGHIHCSRLPCAGSDATPHVQDIRFR